MYTALSLAAPHVLGVAFGGLAWLAIIFFIIAILAYAMGARGMAGMSAGIGRTLLFVFLILFIIALILNFTWGGPGY